MIRIPTKQQIFEATDGPVCNPYIGFTSYQRFRSDPLFFDVAVRPENNGTETEETECYPVKETAVQSGGSSGFYPDTSVAYIRLLWKDLEPRRGEYDYASIGEILQKARRSGQTVMLRLMPHSTRKTDDVPDWLKTMIPCPYRPDGMRVKDSPEDPLFLKLFGEAVEALALRFDPDPTLDVMDISLPGAWGEGHQCGAYPRQTLEELVDVYTRSFRNTRLVGQSAAPWLIEYANKTSPCGWRGDGVGEAKHMTVKYPAVAEALSDLWKTAPVSFESYWWLGEWKRRGWDIDGIIEKTLSWHISTFNAKSFPIPEEWREKIAFWTGRMGYHFALRGFAYPETAKAGDLLRFRLSAENRGVAPIYHRIPLRMRLKAGDREYVFPTGVDVRTWLPGEHTKEFVVPLPCDISAGGYEIGVSISGENTPVVSLETKGESDGRFLTVGRIDISA
ncbi:MAG: DUF4832 domain-containing protein [Clostridia bacterium]|nr:DUF4832 domain-containing protein [Clostridia bacterium]